MRPTRALIAAFALLVFAVSTHGQTPAPALYNTVKQKLKEGKDGIFVASTDLGSFTGLRQGDAKYEALVDRVVAATLKAGLILGGPSAWKDTRPPYTFFQGPDEAALLRSGAKVSLTGQPAAGQPRGVAPIEGSEK